MRVELLNTGTELLMGFVVNTHAAWLGQKLSEPGLSIARQVCVNDDPREMKTCLKEAMRRADLILVTGGLGPTGDDLTRNCVVEMLGLKTRVDARALKNIEERFRRRGGAMPESVKCQAVVPEIATVFHNRNGTAPGLAIPCSRLNFAGKKNPRCRWMLLLPGPPRELRPMFEEQVLPLIRREFAGDLPVVDCRVFRVAGMGESSVEERVRPVLKNLNHLEIGYCARPGEVDVRLVARGKSKTDVRRLADEAEKRTRAALGTAIFGTGNRLLEEAVVNLLRGKNRRLATAESCTGGYVAHRITLVPGSADVFLQGWVTYSNQSKTQCLDVPPHLIRREGAVSESVAKRMAEGARKKAGADYALSLTGIAGPSGGSAEKPAGTVFIALASKQGVSVERFCFQLDRETFKFICAQTALNMLRTQLEKDD